jgi:mono/diheme cytochrome c family protein
MFERLETEKEMRRMPLRNPAPLLIVLGFMLILIACATPHSLPIGSTPIPTLIPATEPGSLLGATEQPSFAIQSYPARPPSAASGEPLYQTHCVNCHGEDGRGVVAGARNFNDLDYIRGETPAFFYTAITEGRGDMPSFQSELTSDERWDVVFYVWQFSTTSERLALGKQLYDANCVACHGADGVGQALGAADFTDLRFIDDLAPRDFYLSVTQGVGSMPAWQGRLSQDERWAVIDYLRTFSYEPSFSSEGAAAPLSTSTPEEDEGMTCDSADASEANPFSWDDEEAIAAGQVIFNQSCAVCHGSDGSGTLPNIIDFTTADAQEDLRADSGKIFCIVAEGKGAMPSWKETLSVEEMWQVITFLANL